MTLGKIHSFVLASIFAVALVASDNGDPPSDPVFWCLSETSAEAFGCYKEAYGFSNSHLGGSLGKELKTLVINDLEGWKQLQDNLRGRTCSIALKNFLGPLRVLLRSESTSDHVCQYSGKKLNDTLDELVKVIWTTVMTIRLDVSRHSHVSLRGSAKVQHINMTRMTDLAARQMHSQSHHTAVSLRNFVLLKLLEQATRDIRNSRGCLNTARSLLTPCPVGYN